jgi:hypothetical protein
MVFSNKGFKVWESSFACHSEGATCSGLMVRKKIAGIAQALKPDAHIALAKMMFNGFPSKKQHRNRSHKLPCQAAVFYS